MENELYHIVDRGVDKRQVFMDEEDYFRFIHDLYEFNNEDTAYTNNYHFRHTEYLDIGCTSVSLKLEQ
jgi:putative transposase